MSYRTPKHIEEQKEQKRRQILSAAAKVFSTRGYQETKVKDIVEEAGVSVGSFYFYFKSKDEIFELLYDEMVNLLCNICEEQINRADPLEKQMETGITNFLKSIMEFRDLAKIMMIEAIGVNPIFEKKRSEKINFFSNFIEEKVVAALEVEIIPPIDARIAANAYIGAINNVINHWLAYGEPENLLDAAPSLIKFNLGGIGLLAGSQSSGCECGIGLLKEGK